MRKILFVLPLIWFIPNASAQNHVIGAGVGYSRFSPTIYANYQFSYKWINLKIKGSLYPEQFNDKRLSSNSDIYLGIKTKEEKRSIFYFNFGATLFNPAKSDYVLEVGQQVNPIINFGYAIAINKHHRITTDISISQYSSLIYLKSGASSRVNNPYILLEVGYAYKLKNEQKK